MSFTLTIRAGPTRLALRAPQLAKATSGPTAAIRAFHLSTPKNAFFTSRTSAPALRPATKASSGLLSRLQGASRGYNYNYSGATIDPAVRRAALLRKLLVGGAVFGGTLVGINLIFNRETREDGGMPAFERSYLNSTFMHTGLGIAIIGTSAYQMIQSGFVYRLMVTNPWVVGIGGLALSFGTMLATRAVDPDK
jgi:growth hormone-inducible transmembrane protein